MANYGDLLTSAEAARLAGVGPTAVKRWADSGVLPCVKTAGGHRRFRRGDVERLLHRRVVEDDWDEWIDLLVHTGDVHDVQARLLQERGRRGAWSEVATQLGGLLVEVGHRWEAGRLSVIEEHLASATLQRALAAVADVIPVSPSAPRALLASAEGDDHTVGLSLVELTLREAGWRTEWAGARTLASEIVERVNRGGLKMVAISASSWSRQTRSLEGIIELLGPACRAAGAELVLGGTGAWPEPPGHGVRLTDLPALFEFARARAVVG